MACPFCALGCRDGRPTMGEVSRSWKDLQLTAHPDLGGTKEAAAYLNATKDYANHCIQNPSKDKEITSKCKRHRCVNREEPSQFPTHQSAGVTVATYRSFPAPLTQTMTGQSLSTPPVQPFEEDPWAPVDRPQAGAPRPPMAYPGPVPAPPPPREGYQSEPSASQTHRTDSESRHAPPLPPPPHLTERQKKKCWQQAFKCRIEIGGCGAEATYSGLGKDPFELAQKAGWCKPNSSTWEKKAYCRNCAAKHLGLPADPLTQQALHLPPTPSLAPPQPAYAPLATPHPWEGSACP